MFWSSAPLNLQYNSIVNKSCSRHQQQETKFIFETYFISYIYLYIYKSVLQLKGLKSSHFGVEMLRKWCPVYLKSHSSSSVHWPVSQKKGHATAWPMPLTFIGPQILSLYLCTVLPKRELISHYFFNSPMGILLFNLALAAGV